MAFDQAGVAFWISTGIPTCFVWNQGVNSFADRAPPYFPVTRYTGIIFKIKCIIAGTLKNFHCIDALNCQYLARNHIRKVSD